MKRFTLTFTAALAVLFAACDAFPLYQDSYYTASMVQPRGMALASAEDLAKIGVDEDYLLDGSYYLAADIDLSAHGEWTPIGTLEAPFSGILNGEGKTISGLSLKGGGAAYTGLFGYILNARLSNFTIEIESGAVVLASAAAQYAGVAVGRADTSNISGVTVKGSGELYMAKVGGTAGSDNTLFYAGGLAGYIDGSTISDAKVSLNLKVAGGVRLCTGLIAGESSQGAITRCSVEGSIDAVTVLSAISAGGIAGYIDAPVENCVSSVSRVYAENTGNFAVYVGGISGRNGTGRVTSCRLEAEHTVTIYGKTTNLTTTFTNTFVYIGGISGNTNVPPMGVTGTTNIDKCVVDADVTIIAEAEGFSSLYAGGIAGYSANISNSFVRRGEVMARAPYSGASVNAACPIYAGGISGNISVGTAFNLNGILNCFSRANVTAESALRSTAGLSISNTVAAGGIAGIFNGQYNYIERSGASGTVRAVSSNSEAAAKTVAVAGGIVGSSQNVANTIVNCAALNPLLTAESAATQPYTYRVMGCVYNSTTSILGPDDAKQVVLDTNYALPDMEVRTKQGDGEWTDIPQEPNNTANLMGSGNMEQTQAFFEGVLGWNFETTWTWDAEANLPVPRYN